MALQLSVAARNAGLDSFETTVGTSAHLVMLTGAPPASCATAESGTRLAVMTLPADYMADAANGSKAKSGTWQVNASGIGTIGYFRIYNSGETTCGMQGTVTITGSGGDLTVDNTNTQTNQSITITGFTINAANA